MALALCYLYDRFLGAETSPVSLPPSPPSSDSSSPRSMDEYVVKGALRRRGHIWDPGAGRHVPIGGNPETPQSFSQRVCSLRLVAKDSFQSSCRWLSSRDWSGYASKLRDSTCYLGRGIKSLCLKIDYLVEKYIGGQD